MDSRICYSHKVWLDCRMFAALTAWCERTCCLLSCLRGPHLSISWTCSELPPLCFKYGRYLHSCCITVVLPKLFLTECGKYCVAQCLSLQVSMVTHSQVSHEIKKSQNASPSNRRSKKVTNVRLHHGSILLWLPSITWMEEKVYITFIHC